MISRLLGRRRAPSHINRAEAPEGMRLYAIGDMHGRLDLLTELLALIEADHRMRTPARCRIIGLGDYIDRGPDSARLLDRLAAGPPRWAEWVLLRGNHEQSLIDILEHEDIEAAAQILASWKIYGGAEALLSWGAGAQLAYGDDHAAAVTFLQTRVSPAQRRVLHAMGHVHRAGDYCFVHAGVRPGVPIDTQSVDDLLWIRGEFLQSDADFGAVIVHGHTPSDVPELLPNRINVDTEAWRSGRLTAVALEGTEQRIIQTGG